MIPIALAFVSGVVIEALYVLGVVIVADRRAALAGLLSAVWGFAVLVGVNESLLVDNHTAAVAWCLGLGVGSALGVWLAPEDKATKELFALRAELAQLRAMLESRGAQCST